MSTSEKYISEVPMKDKPKIPIGLFLRDKSVTTRKLADEAVTEEKLADDSVSSDKIKDGNIDFEKLSEETQDLIKSSTGVDSPLIEDMTKWNRRITTLEEEDKNDKEHLKNIDNKDSEQDKHLKQLDEQDKAFNDTLENISKTGEASAASNVTYNPNNSGLTATNAQNVIDEVYKKSNYNDGENIIDFNSIHLIKDNPEYFACLIDADEKIVIGIKNDADVYYGAGVPTQVKDYINKQVNQILGVEDVTSKIDSLREIEAFLEDFGNSDTLKALLDTKANADDVEATTDNIYKKSNPNDSEGNIVDTNTIFSIEDNPEYIKALTDSIGKLIEAIGLDGVRKFFAGINIQGTMQCVTDNPEYIAVWLDNQERIIFGFKINGDIYIDYGVPSQVKEYISTINANIQIELNSIKQDLTNTKEDIDKKINLGDNTYPSNVYEIYDNPDFITANVDSVGHILEAVGLDGVRKFFEGINVQGTLQYITDNPEYIAAWIDTEGKLIFAINKKGELVNKYTNLIELYKEIKECSQQVDSYSDDISLVFNTARNGYSPNFFRKAQFYYHFNPQGFVYDGNGKKAFACESIFDVEFASRLGFKYVEANIQKLKDGTFICMHGHNGVFDSSVKSIDESVITTDNLRTKTFFASVTYDWVKKYVRYDSDYEKYSTVPTTLDEFLRACAENNIGVVLGSNPSMLEDVLSLARRYLNNDIILYNYDTPSDIRKIFNGYLFKWYFKGISGAPDPITPEFLEKEVDKYGNPLIVGLDQPILDAWGEEATSAFIQTMHKKGAYLLFAGVYTTEEKTRKNISQGFDLAGSGHQVNDFEPNYECYCNDNEESGITTTGEMNDEQVLLQQNETMTCGSATKIIGKGLLKIRFNGKLTISFGSQGSSGRTISSNGEEMIIVSDYFFKRGTTIIVTAITETKIAEFLFKTSKC